MDESTQPTGSITEELGRLGQSLGQAMKQVWESDERKRLEQDIAEGLRRLSDQIDAAMKAAAESDAAQEAADKAGSAWQTAHGPQILAEIRAGLVESLHKLNQELDQHLQKARPEKETK